MNDKIHSSQLGLALICAIIASAVTNAQECGKPFISPGKFNDLANRIVGGKEAIPGSWPWQAYLIYKTKECKRPFDCEDLISFCGASIINNQWLVTAAHCLSDDLTASKYTIRVGQHRYTDVPEASVRSHTIRRIIIHPSFSERTNNNDIALLQVNDPIEFSSIVGPVCLPAAGSDPVAGRTCIATGWGDTEQTTPQPRIVTFGDKHNKSADSLSSVVKEIGSQSTILRQVELNVLARSRCNGPEYYDNSITNAMICAGTTGKDACQGDSGGPFVCQNQDRSYTLEGVVSWGDGCGVKNRPGVFTRTGLFVSWINDNLLAYQNSARSISDPIYGICFTSFIFLFRL